MFSRRTQRALSPNALALAVEKRPPRYDLTVSNPTVVGLSEVVSLPAAARYEPEPFGIRSAREAVARWYGGARDAEVVLTASSSEAYQWLMQLCADVGDQWLVPAPSYPLLDELARLASVELVRYPLRFDGEWVLDVEVLEACAGPRTRAVVVVAPANPTGHSPSEAEWSVLEALCVRRGWALVVDEVFAAPERSRVRRPAGPLRFVLGGLSKAAGQPQLKLSWMVVQGPRELTRPALGRLEWMADALLSVATPVQLALPALLEGSVAFRARVAQRRSVNLESLRAACPPDYSLLPAEAGWSAVVRVGEEPDEMTRCLELLERGVLVHPGFFYDFPTGKHLVVSLLPEPEVFSAGARALSPL